MTNLPMILGMLFWLEWALFCSLALFVAKDENKYLKNLLFSMFMIMLLIKVGGY
ncbi:hypothetical protein [Bacillus paranthracis]|uniref:hypothetical protein n=1 Tax=Bacillus paranthracis TaxID=2026186 RepID=UPI003D1C22A8